MSSTPGSSSSCESAMSDYEQDVAELKCLEAERPGVLITRPGRDRDLALMDVTDRINVLNYRMEAAESDRDAEITAKLDTIDNDTWPAIPLPTTALPPAAPPFPRQYPFFHQPLINERFRLHNPDVHLPQAATSSSTSIVAQRSTTASASATLLGPIAFAHNEGVIYKSPNREILLKGTPKMLNVPNVLPRFEFTIGEMITFFCLHFTWDGILLRCHAVDWKQIDIARYIARSRGLQNSDRADPDSLRSTIGHNFKRVKHIALQPITFNATADGWRCLQKPDSTGRVGYVSDCELLRLASGVTRLPTGSDRGALTIAVEHARRNRHGKVMLSQVRQYIQQYNLVVPTIPLTREDDRKAYQNFKA